MRHEIRFEGDEWCKRWRFGIRGASLGRAKYPAAASIMILKAICPACLRTAYSPDAMLSQYCLLGPLNFF